MTSAGYSGHLCPRVSPKPVEVTYAKGWNARVWCRRNEKHNNPARGAMLSKHTGYRHTVVTS